MAQYFTEDTDKYIVAFLDAETDEKKHALFNEGIRPAFEKLIENLIYVYKFYTLEDDVDVLKRDCLSALYETIKKFDREKAKKGFSYFNVVAKNWFIQKTRERSKKNRIEQELRVDIDKDFVKNNITISCSPHEDQILEKEMWKSLMTEAESWRERFSKKNEKKVLEASLFLMKNSQLVDIYSKKAVYVYLRDMTGLNEKQIATSLKKIREFYSKWKSRYYDEGI